MNDEQKDIREKIARVICCFANENESCADCKENHPGSLFPDCFSDIREHTDQLLALFPDREEIEKQATLEQAAFDQLNFDKERVAFWARIEEAKREGEKRIYNWGNEDCPHNNTIKLKVKRGCIACWQALKGD